MKRFASTFSVIGVASGVLFALGPWIYGNRSPAPASFLMPFMIGAVLIATHWFTFRKIQAGSGTCLGLLLPNAVLLAVILLGFLFLPSNPASDDRPTLRMSLLAAVFLVPLASNVLYLSFRSRASGSQSHGS